ncbi:heme-binding protein [Falsirhodobacter sp. 20TX0035]|nr:heme-binding protein [Falsirhodobacter sp. 20TX0035]
MIKTCLVAMTTFGALALPLSAEVRMQPVITLQTAQDVVDAALEKAAAEGWPGVVAVTDPAGDLLAFARMDDAAVPAGVTVAPGKARTAALFARPSGDLETAINGSRAAAATAGGFVMMKGGLPLIVDGQVVGAIGVSADTPDHDQAIAEAGAAVLAE